MKKLRKILSLCGRRSLKWMTIGAAASVTLGLVDYGVAAFIQLFLYTLDIADKTNAPSWLDHYFPKIELFELVMFLVFLGLVKGLSQFFIVASATITAELINARLRLQTAFEILISKKTEYFSNSEVNNRFGEIFPRAGALINYSVRLSVIIIQISILVFGMIYIAWREALLGIAGIGIIGIFVIFINKKVRKLAEFGPIHNHEVLKSVDIISRNWMFLKVSRTERTEYIKLTKNISRYFDTITKTSLLANIAANIPPLVGISLLASIIWISKNHFNTENTSLLAFLYLFIRFIQQIANAASSFGVINANLAYFKIALKIFHDQPLGEIQEALKPSKNLRLIKKLHDNTPDEPLPMLTKTVSELSAPEIVIKNMSFAWETNNVLIFENLNLIIKSGSTLGIKGRSGSGKSTLLKLILGLIEPTHGCIKIGGKTSKNFLNDSNIQIGYVGVEPFLISGSIQDNLVYGLERVFTSDELWESLEKAQLKETVTMFSNGLKHQIDEIGAGLSAGQKQRLSLARALLRKPALLVLDEITSNLDEETENQVAEMLDSLDGSTTILLVSHRQRLFANITNMIDLG